MNSIFSAGMIPLIIFCIFAEAAREVCFKLAADHETLKQAVFKWQTLLGIVLWAVELIGWTVVLQHVPLSIAFPVMSLVYVTIVAAGAVIFKESINNRHVLGTFLITAGVACVGATGI